MITQSFAALCLFSLYLALFVIAQKTPLLSLHIVVFVFLAFPLSDIDSFLIFPSVFLFLLHSCLPFFSTTFIYPLPHFFPCDLFLPLFLFPGILLCCSLLYYICHSFICHQIPSYFLFYLLLLSFCSFLSFFLSSQSFMKCLPSLPLLLSLSFTSDRFGCKH